MVQSRKTLYKTYKGKEYKAYLSPSGFIVYKNRKYNTPTAAAKAVTKRKAVSGWRFCYIKDKNGEWVRLCDYMLSLTPVLFRVFQPAPMKKIQTSILKYRNLLGQ